MSFLDPIIEWATNLLSPYITMPNSTLFILVLSLALGLIMMAANRLLTDVKRLQEYEREVRKYMSSLNDARKRNDKAALKKLKREETKINTMQSYVSKQRLKVTMIFMIPFMLIFTVLNSIFAEVGTVALTPFDFPFIGRNIPFLWWYMICSFAVNFPLYRLFGLTPVAEAKPERKPEEKPVAKAKRPHKKRKKA